MNRRFIAFAIVVVLVGVIAGRTAADEPKPAVIGNSICPVSGQPVAGKPDAPTFYSDFKGWRIGFMCPVCKGKFDAADAAQKLAYLNKALTSAGKPPVE
jgi:hypothetical protein